MPDEWERDGDNFDKTMHQFGGGVKVSMKGVDQNEGGTLRSNRTIRDSISDACQPTTSIIDLRQYRRIDRGSAQCQKQLPAVYRTVSRAESS